MQYMHSKSHASGTHYLYWACSSELYSTCAGKLCMHSGHVSGNWEKKDLIPFFQPEENYSHVKETKTYGHHGFLVVLENKITTPLSKTEAVDINDS